MSAIGSILALPFPNVEDHPTVPTATCDRRSTVGVADGRASTVPRLRAVRSRSR